MRDHEFHDTEWAAALALWFVASLAVGCLVALIIAGGF